MINNKFYPVPLLRSSRIILRQITLDDAQEIFLLRSNKQNNTYIKREIPKTIDDAIEFITKITKGSKLEENVNWSICLKDSPKLIGSICLWHFSSDNKTAEVGYDLMPEYQSQGIGSEALNLVVQYGFQTLNLNRITAYTQRQNEHSIALLKKNGFTLHVGAIDPNNSDNIIFEITNGSE